MAGKKEQLETAGWKLASVSGGEHLERAIEMYHELGIEVYVEEVKPEDCAGCTECYTASNQTINRIYTRGKGEHSETPPGMKD